MKFLSLGWDEVSALCGCCWGCCCLLTQSNKFAWIASQSSYIRYWKTFLWRQLSYWAAVLLCSFAPFCLLFSNSLRMQALKAGQGWENFHACKPSLSPLLQYLAHVELAFPEQGECYLLVAALYYLYSKLQCRVQSSFLHVWVEKND